MKILKFGGKSLANGQGLTNSISTIVAKVQAGENVTVVASARGNTTNELEEILEKAANKKSYKEQLEALKKYQQEITKLVDFSEEFSKLDTIFKGVELLGDYSQKIKDETLAQGELLSVKLIEALLKEQNINANATDARKLIVTNENFGNARPLEKESKENIQKHFSIYNGTTVNVVTGFIGSNKRNQTTTLGRNGSNYTASLLANFLDADELQNYTHVDGIFTANPTLVADAKKNRTPFIF